MTKTAVDLIKISKKYVLHHHKPTLMENIFYEKKRENFYALKDINLKIKQGEKLGIIGPNGSGKTTLLEIMAGVITPSSGKMKIMGKIASLIELGAGFHPEFSGRENIIVNGMLLGMSYREIKSKQKKIIKFTDIGKFIEAPFYTYSDGMRLRLGFAVAVHARPDILLLDENMAVGDRDFQEKSLAKIQDFFIRGKTIIIASHRLDILKDICDRVVWLEKGRIKKIGTASRIIKMYDKKQMQGLRKTKEPDILVKYLKSLAMGKTCKMHAGSSSMSPLIEIGDELTMRKIAINKVKKGEVIAFYSPKTKKIVVHRAENVIKNNKKIKIYTRGDQNFLRDWQVINQNNFLGRIETVNKKIIS